MDNSKIINKDSGDYEYYTPPDIIEAVTEVMGYIDLDPASSIIANKRIHAKKIFTQSGNSLEEEWLGNIWLNHPFSRGWKACDEFCDRTFCNDKGYHTYENLPSNKDWMLKLVSEYEKGNINQACCITFAATSEKWFRPLMDYAQCFLSPRTHYYLSNGRKKKGVTKGSVITYFGKNVEKFIEVFDDKFGKVKI